MRIQKLAAVSLAALTIVTGGALTACSGTAKTGTKYTITPDRNLRANVAADLATTHQAALRAVRDDLGFTVESETIDALEGHIKGKTARGDRVEVETFKEGERLTRVDVFVGPMGDEPKMSELFSAIEKRLN